MVDYICWRHYGFCSPAVEAVYEANPGLAERGAVLEAGIEIVLPDIEAAADGVVRLWD